MYIAVDSTIPCNEQCGRTVAVGTKTLATLGTGWGLSPQNVIWPPLWNILQRIRRWIIIIIIFIPQVLLLRYYYKAQDRPRATSALCRQQRRLLSKQKAVLSKSQQRHQLIELWNFDRFCTQNCKQCLFPDSLSSLRSWTLLEDFRDPNTLGYPKWKFMALPLTEKISM